MENPSSYPKVKYIDFGDYLLVIDIYDEPEFNIHYKLYQQLGIECVTDHDFSPTKVTGEKEE